MAEYHRQLRKLGVRGYISTFKFIIQVTSLIYAGGRMAEYHRQLEAGSPVVHSVHVLTVIPL